MNRFLFPRGRNQLPNCRPSRRWKLNLSGTCVLGLACMGGLANAQSYSPVGPRYPGETIISERVISPRAETLPAPKQSSSSRPNPTLSIAGQEPMSLSDGGAKNERSLSDQPPLFALGHEAWKRMLDLERENAQLQADLEYERKLATYFEHSQNVQQKQSMEIAKLRQEIELLERESQQVMEEASESLEKLVRENKSYQKKLESLQRELAMSQTQRLANNDEPKTTRSNKGVPDEEKTSEPNQPKMKGNSREEATPRIAESKNRDAKNPSPRLYREQNKQTERTGRGLPRITDRQSIDNLPMVEPEPRKPELPAPTELPMPTEMPSTDELPSPAPTEPESSLKASIPNEETTTERKKGEPEPSETPKVTWAVMPIGFEITDGLVKPIEPRPFSNGAIASNVTTDVQPVDQEGLQGGALGPLGRSDSAE